MTPLIRCCQTLPNVPLERSSTMRTLVPFHQDIGEVGADKRSSAGNQNTTILPERHTLFLLRSDFDSNQSFNESQHALVPDFGIWKEFSQFSLIQ